MTKNLVSVIMGVHNEKDEYLITSINSICDQTYRTFEFIIIDDCSDDGCNKMLQEFARKDQRIRLIRNDMNLGLTRTLNLGLSLAEGEYIARMDADDYSVPDRFEKQIYYLSCHPDIDIVGGGVVSFGEETCYMSPVSGYTSEDSQCELFFQSTLCHPSVMIRKSFLDEHDLKYDESVRSGQDYDMWERCSVFGKLAVMQDVLLYYRTHSTQISSTKRSEQDDTARMVRARRLNRIGITPTDSEYQCHLMLLGMVDKSVESLEVENWMNKILVANKKYEIADENALSKNLHYRYILYKARNGNINITDLPAYVSVVVNRLHMHFMLNKVKSLIKRSNLS